MVQKVILASHCMIFFTGAIVQALAEEARAVVQAMAAAGAENSTRHGGTQTWGPTIVAP